MCTAFFPSNGRTLTDDAGDAFLVADALGLTFQKVQKYEKGANRIGAICLRHISQILDVPVPPKHNRSHGPPFLNFGDPVRVRTGLCGNAIRLWTPLIQFSDIEKSSSRDSSRDSRLSLQFLQNSWRETGSFPSNPRKGRHFRQHPKFPGGDRGDWLGAGIRNWKWQNEI
jgi:hypothetical protein